MKLNNGKMLLGKSYSNDSLFDAKNEQDRYKT